jgi:hypothetical protein
MRAQLGAVALRQATAACIRAFLLCNASVQVRNVRACASSACIEAAPSVHGRAPTHVHAAEHVRASRIRTECLGRKSILRS